jgi:small GTP-binding protein
MEVHGRHLELLFCDTEGQEDYDRLRPLSYLDSAIILITFAIDAVLSFENVTQRWALEVLHYCSSSKIPILLVGCKTDLRMVGYSRAGLSNTETEGKTLITHQQGTMLAAKI